MVPDFKIQANGSDITGEINKRLISLNLVDKRGSKSDRLTIVLDDRDQLLEIPKKSAKLKLWLGFVETGVELMGQYSVDDVGLSGPARTMTIRASAADMTGSVKAPKERSWHDKTLEEVAKKIAGEHGLVAKVDSQFGSIKIEHEDQTESDMQFLARLCQGIGCVFKVANGNLIIAETYSGKTGSGKAMPTITISASQCSAWNAELTGRGKYGKAKARYYDPEQGGDIGTEEEDDGEGPELLVSKTYRDKASAKNAARSALSAKKASTGRLQIKGLTGNPSLSAETKLQLKEFRVGVDELDWSIESVTHTLSRGTGYICDIQAEVKGTK